jgi:RNA polymerase subunit RPABC4/transcription elongation factor Spt4
MALAFCSACGQDVYLGQDDQNTCPVCSSGLAETEDTIRVRLLGTT